MGPVLGFYDDGDEPIGLIITMNLLNYMERFTKGTGILWMN
jgi:hypothetical protein